MITRLSRRRFLTISAAACAAPYLSAAAPTAVWRGLALGARAEVLLAGVEISEAAPIFASLEAELGRIDRLFSLYRRDSALCRLNRDGQLHNAPPDFLKLLSIARSVHAATEGAFDPTVQPIFALHAERAVAGMPVDTDELRETHARVGFEQVRFDNELVHFDRPGMAMTFNGIAQGYATDRLADLLRRAGLRNVMVDAGEIRAIGRANGNAGWPVRLPGGQLLRLENRSAATSALSGTLVDPARGVGHIFDPSRGRERLRLSPVTAIHDSAAIADAASTAAIVLNDQQLGLLRNLDVEIVLPA